MKLPVVLFAMVCLSVAAAAQEPGDVEPGTRVRISTKDAGKETGVVASSTADALVIRFEGESVPRAISFADLVTIETSRGPRSRSSGAWHKAKWGALIGAVSTVPGAILLHDEVGEDGASVGEAVALGVWSGGLIGGLIGAAIGAAHPGERWEKVTPAVHVLPRESGGGFTLQATIRF
ncbi:MAG TPA: hypothetical protein VLK65_06210 [Vicinamibacteria bacterium]|nr:hypothetical protein [Vicinamibacteria bacterium]